MMGQCEERRCFSTGHLGGPEALADKGGGYFARGNCKASQKQVDEELECVLNCRQKKAERERTYGNVGVGLSKTAEFDLYTLSYE